jgi:hypothetical protein
MLTTSFTHSSHARQQDQKHSMTDEREREIAKASYIKDVLPMSFNV